MFALKTIGFLMIFGILIVMDSQTAMACISSGSTCIGGDVRRFCCPGYFCYQQPGWTRGYCKRH